MTGHTVVDKIGAKCWNLAYTTACAICRCTGENLCRRYGPWWRLENWLAGKQIGADHA